MRRDDYNKVRQTFHIDESATGLKNQVREVFHMRNISDWFAFILLMDDEINAAT